MKKILIVEDQSGPLEALEFAVRKVFPAYFPQFHHDLVQCHEDAQRLIRSGYDIILLDHIMPLKNMGNLEDIDFELFSKSLKPVGYSLINDIREQNPQTIVIGTSSLTASELRMQPPPDYVMSKQWNQAEKDLVRILAEVGTKNK